MPRELYLRLKKHIQSGRLVIHKDNILSVDQHQIHTEQASLPYDFILLATGFEPTLLKQPMIQSLIKMKVHL